MSCNTCARRSGGVQKMRGRAGGVARRAASFVEDRTQPRHCCCITLRCGQFGPLPGDHVVRIGFALEVDASQRFLRFRMALSRRGLQRAHRTSIFPASR